MYDRFSDRARSVIKLANTEAQRFSHNYIGTEHILLGLLKDDEGLSTHILIFLGADRRKIRTEMENILQPGPELVTMARMPMTPSAKKVIENAIRESANLEHAYIGTEHLLLGLLKESEGVAFSVLMKSGLSFERVLQEIKNSLEHDSQSIEIVSPSNSPNTAKQSQPLSESAKTAIYIVRNLTPSERKIVIKKILNHTIKVDPPSTLSDIGFNAKSKFWPAVWDFILWLIPFPRKQK